MDSGLFSADGRRVLFADNLGDISNVFVYDVQADKATAVTNSKRPAYPISFVPGNGRLMYRARPENQSVEHLFIHEAGSPDTDLTP